MRGGVLGTGVCVIGLRDSHPLSDRTPKTVGYMLSNMHTLFSQRVGGHGRILEGMEDRDDRGHVKCYLLYTVIKLGSPDVVLVMTFLVLILLYLVNKSCSVHCSHTTGHSIKPSFLFIAADNFRLNNLA